jgi:hypothetical protein
MNQQIQDLSYVTLLTIISAKSYDSGSIVAALRCDESFTEAIVYHYEIDQRKLESPSLGLRKMPGRASAISPDNTDCQGLNSTFSVNMKKNLVAQW